MYVRMYVRMHPCMHACMYTYIYMSYIHVDKYLYICASMRVRHHMRPSAYAGCASL